MKAVGLNGREYKMKFTHDNKSDRKSSHHLRARALLQDIFKGYSVYEEVKLPGTVDPAKRSALFLDFFIPNLDLAIEVHGEQHFRYVPFFHKTKAGFLQSRVRDSRKAEWCELNGINLLVLRFDESIEQWEAKINECR